MVIFIRKNLLLMNLTDVYGYIKKNLADDYSVLKNKVDEFAGEGLEPIRIYNILSQYIALKPFCRALDVKNGDYIEFIKAIKIATFLKAKFKAIIYYLTPKSQ